MPLNNTTLSGCCQTRAAAAANRFVIDGLSLADSRELMKEW
jgi:hypothetical protein